jgi:hypothetical protein
MLKMEDLKKGKARSLPLALRDMKKPKTALSHEVE